MTISYGSTQLAPFILPIPNNICSNVRLAKTFVQEYGLPDNRAMMLNAKTDTIYTGYMRSTRLTIKSFVFFRSSPTAPDILLS